MGRRGAAPFVDCVGSGALLGGSDDGIASGDEGASESMVEDASLGLKGLQRFDAPTENWIRDFALGPALS